MYSKEFWELSEEKLLAVINSKRRKRVTTKVRGLAQLIREQILRCNDLSISELKTSNRAWLIEASIITLRRELFLADVQEEFEAVSALLGSYYVARSKFVLKTLE